MRRGLVGISLAVALVIARPAFAADKADKDKEKAEAKTEAKEKQKLLASAYFDGTLGQVETTSKWFTVQATYKIGVPNVGAQQNLASLQQQMLQARLTTRDPVALAQKMADLNRQIAQQSANLVSYQDRHINFELQSADDMKVRLATPPVAFDDKGKPKKYTQKELAELKGPDKKLPGFNGDFENLRPGQKVRVWLSKVKNPPRTAKNADKDAPAEKHRMSVVMVLIVESPKD